MIPTSDLGLKMLKVGPSNRAVWGVGLWPLACWDCGFESRRGHRCLSVVSVVCQVENSASGWSLIQRSPTDCGVCNWVWSWIIDNEEALALWGLLHHSKMKECWGQKGVWRSLLDLLQSNNAPMWWQNYEEPKRNYQDSRCILEVKRDNFTVRVICFC
jgi:hypothetical protein